MQSSSSYREEVYHPLFDGFCANVMVFPLDSYLIVFLTSHTFLQHIPANLEDCFLSSVQTNKSLDRNCNLLHPDFLGNYPTGGSCLRKRPDIFCCHLHHKVCKRESERIGAGMQTLQDGAGFTLW